MVKWLMCLANKRFYSPIVMNECFWTIFPFPFLLDGDKGKIEYLFNKRSQNYMKNFATKLAQIIICKYNFASIHSTRNHRYYTNKKNEFGQIKQWKRTCFSIFNLFLWSYNLISLRTNMKWLKAFAHEKIFY